jgi:hypothetical protein
VPGVIDAKGRLGSRIMRLGRYLANDAGGVQLGGSADTADARRIAVNIAKLLELLKKP